MKLTKMSLVTALLIGSSAFAIDNVKVSGNAQVFYNTSDTKYAGYGKVAQSDTLFSKDNSAADAGLNLNASADLFKNDLVSISTGAGYTVLSTLGLENNFVSNVWGGAHKATVPASGVAYGKALGGAQVDTANWVNEAWVAVSAGKTTAKIGRMALDTPLVFTETWSIEKNTFESAVLINQDIPDTTLVGAYVGTGNGTETFGQDARSGIANNSIAGTNLAVGPVVNAGGKFTTYGTNGAYAAGIINNSYKPLTVQAWYFSLSKLANAYWLQADLSMDGVMAGAQYANESVNGSGTKDDNVYALMLGYEMKDVATAKISYSSVNDDGYLGGAGANTATSTGASKLYTEAWWNYGYVTRSNTNSFNITVTSPVQGLFDLGLYYTNANQDKGGNIVTPVDMQEFTLTASKSFGPLDATLAYINTNADDQNNGDSFNTIQAYLTLNF